MSTASSSPDGSSVKGGLVDAETAEKQLSRCEEMVQHSIERCERVPAERQENRERRFWLITAATTTAGVRD